MDNEQSGLREDRISERTVSYIVFESAQARSERTIKRLIIALIMTIIFLFLSNAYWVYQWNQYDYETVSFAQDGTGLNSINLGRQGDVNYEPSVDNQAQAPEEAEGD